MACPSASTGYIVIIHYCTGMTQDRAREGGFGARAIVQLERVVEENISQEQ